MTLELKSVTAKLGRRVVLSNISATLVPGEFVGLVGANGSGKSTLLRCIAGILKPVAGQIVVAGHDLDASGDEARKAVGYAADPKVLPNELTGRQCLELIAGARQTDTAATTPLIEALSFERWLPLYVGEYSSGTRQKLSILAALIGEPPLLLFDESLNGLDPASSWAVKDHLVHLSRERKRTVVLATHGIDAAADLFDRMIVLNEGQCLGVWDRNGLATLRAQGSLERGLARQLQAR
jgi:ABC-2 type transport system ATP-binding protein